MPDITDTMPAARLTDSFNAITKAASARFQRQEFEDYHNDIAGQDVGRYRKHTRKADDRDPATGESKKAAALRRTLEWLLLNDAEYARLHKAASKAVSDAAVMLEATKSKVASALDEVNSLIAASMDKAAKLPDGTAVFQDAQGRVRDADGGLIADDIAAGIVWRGDEPSFEEHRALLARKREIDQAANDVLIIESDLGALQGELANDDPPVSKDRLSRIPDDVDAMRDKLSGIQRLIDKNVEPAANADLRDKSAPSAAAGKPLLDVPVVKIGN